MMNRTGIQYLTHTWNPTHGCSPISPGCENCWACTMSKRLAVMDVQGYDKENPFAVTMEPDRILEPIYCKKPARIGVSFMGDLFHLDIPYSFICDVMSTITKCPQHTFLLLTKRPERMVYFFDGRVPKNCWLGVTAENQKMADKRIPVLLSIPAAVRFVSVEPMLGPIDLTAIVAPDGDGPGCGSLSWIGMDTSIDWVIAGCESGPHRRPCKTEWLLNLRDQCVAANVPFFCKQAQDEYTGKVEEMPRLNGWIWNQIPGVTP